jgi:hypothetical protein
MAVTISSWLKGRPSQPSNAYIADEDDIAGLIDSIELDLIDADAEIYMEKYWQFRKQVDEGEICNDLRADNACL